MSVIASLVARRRHRWAREALLLICNLEVPAQVVIGRDLTFHHRGLGTVIHPGTSIGDRVQIYHNVTIGRADSYIPFETSKFEGIEIMDDAVLSPGSKVLCKSGVLRVGRGTVIGANAVLLTSTGDWETWAGVPARCVGRRLSQGEGI